MTVVRNSIFSFFVWMMGLQIVVAQQDIDTSYNTTYYEQKTSLFRLLPDGKGELVFLGNSITDIGEWAEIWQNKKVINRGISSDNTFGVLARMDDVLASKPKKIFLLIGINDIARNTPDSVIINNFKKIIQRVQSASGKTKLYVQSILPTNNQFTQFTRHQNKEAHLLFINHALEQICQQQNVTYVDLYSRFLDKEGRLDKQYTNDGLHLMGAGFMLWKTILKEKCYLK